VRPSRDPDGVVNSLGAFGTVYEGISHIGAGGSERSPVGLTTDGLHSMPNEGCARALSGWVNWLVPILARAVGGPQSGRYMDAWLAWAPLPESDLAGFTVAIQRTGSEAAQARAKRSNIAKAFTLARIKTRKVGGQAARSNLCGTTTGPRPLA
jgi:hypothetical protein